MGADVTYLVIRKSNCNRDPEKHIQRTGVSQPNIISLLTCEVKFKIAVHCLNLINSENDC